MMNVIDLVDKTSTRITQKEKPSAGKGSILVKVSFSALDTILADVAKRGFVGSILHDVKVNPLVPGYHFSGSVESIGPGVTDFRVGDVVFGHLQYNGKQKQGSCSEYIVVPEKDCAKAPDNIPIETAAASTTEGLTALQALRDTANLSSGESVLILGAGGGVGSAAVGMAQVLKAGSISAICSTKDVEWVKSLGAEEVIDRKVTDISKLPRNKYDVIFDPSAKNSFSSLKRLLKKGGRMVNTIPHWDYYMFGNWLYPCMYKKSFRFIHVVSNQKDLNLLSRCLVDGSVKVPIDSIHKMTEFADAWERQNDRTRRGRVILKVDGGWS
jgi:NADPH:quinone reductase-like Zn-dependent oxidoreductase